MTLKSSENISIRTKISSKFWNRYPNYTFIGDADIANSASLATRYTDNSLLGILVDFYFLSNSDYLVCTLSSQVKKHAIFVKSPRIFKITTNSDMQRSVRVEANAAPRRRRPDPFAGRHLLFRGPGIARSCGCHGPHSSKTWRDRSAGRR